MAVLITHEDNIMASGQNMIITCPQIKLKVIATSKNLLIPIKKFPFYQIFIEGAESLTYVGEDNDCLLNADEYNDHDLLRYFKDAKANVDKHQIFFSTCVEI